MAMPSTSLTWGDKLIINLFSGILFLISCLWYRHKRIRSIGICNLPLSIALFCKFARPFASSETRRKSVAERKKHDDLNRMTADKIDNSVYHDYEDPLDDPIFVRNCLLWSLMQLVCVLSGIFDWYCDILIKGAVIFHIGLTVSDSITQRPILQREEEVRLIRQQKLKLESALFWKCFLPPPIWKAKVLGFKKVVDDATTGTKKPTATTTSTLVTSSEQSGESNNDGGNHNQKQKEEELRKSLQKTKNLLQGKRITATDDLIWGAIQIAYVGFEVDHKQALGTAFMCYLCTLLEEALGFGDVEDEKKKKIKKFKLLWIIFCVYVTGKLFFI